MINKFLIFLAFILLFTASKIVSQSEFVLPDSIYQEIRNDKKLIELNNYLQNLSLDEMDSLKHVLNYYNNFLDSAKYLYELKIILREDLKNVEGLSLVDEMIEHQQRRDLLLRTAREYYKAQPNYDLGIVGKYLGVSKQIAVIALALMTL